jgi:PucR C-terminal helix-turn-helix domain/GGDEF-like domain
MRLLESSLPGMNGDTVRRQVAEVAEALVLRTDELASDLAQAIAAAVGLYQTTTPVPFDVVVAGCAANVRSVLEAIAADTEFDPTAAEVLGKERARDGVPLAAVLEAYRVGFHRVWDAAVTELATRGHNGQALRVLTAKIFAAQDIFTNAMAVSYRDEQCRQASSDESDRSVLIDAVLHGRLFEQSNVWEAADYLRLPTQGPFVVIAAEVPVIGAEALPEIESKLRSIDVFSAWRLLPDVQVGIVHVGNDKHLDHALALVSRMATNRVGVSARFDDLRETAQALRFARLMLRGHADPGQQVSLFDGSILATAAVSAPEIMVRLVAPTIESFAELADNERDVLFDTFRVWLENDGSLRAAGELLFCHPNTVRYRLHRIEQRTGRSLSRPRDVAELSLAFEVHRRLIWQPEERPHQGDSR